MRTAQRRSSTFAFDPANGVETPSASWNRFLINEQFAVPPSRCFGLFGLMKNVRDGVGEGTKCHRFRDVACDLEFFALLQVAGIIGGSHHNYGKIRHSRHGTNMMQKVGAAHARQVGNIPILN